MSNYIRAAFPDLDVDGSPPGSVCDCGSADVDITDGKWHCNNCNAKGTIRIVVEKDDPKRTPTFDLPPEYSRRGEL